MTSLWPAAILSAQFLWDILSSPATSVVLLLIVLARISSQRTAIDGIYRRLALREAGHTSLDDDEDFEEHNSDPAFPALDELVRHERLQRAARSQGSGE